MEASVVGCCGVPGVNFTLPVGRSVTVASWGIQMVSIRDNLFVAKCKTVVRNTDFFIFVGLTCPGLLVISLLSWLGPRLLSEAAAGFRVVENTVVGCCGVSTLPVTRSEAAASAS